MKECKELLLRARKELDRFKYDRNDSSTWDIIDDIDIYLEEKKEVESE